MRIIDADAFHESVFQRYCKNCNSQAHRMCHACWVMDMMDELKEAPTINPEDLRLKGKWEAPEEHGFLLKVKGKHLGTICSCCCSWSDNQYDFCPNCGAKMEE